MKVEVNQRFNSRLPENDAHPYRTGAWQPQSPEHTVSEMQVTGEIPKDLNGVYLRNTENPLHDLIERHHPFGYDGMIPMMSFEYGEVQYGIQFVCTQGLATEIAAGSAQWAWLAKMPARSPRTDGWGVRTRMKDASSTDIIVHAGVAVSSFYQCGDLYRLDPRTLEDLGREIWSGKFPTQGVLARTKVYERTANYYFSTIK